MHYEQTIRELEERLKVTVQAEESAFRSIADRLTRLEQSLGQQRTTRELVEEQRRKELKIAESNANLQLGLELKDFTENAREEETKFDLCAQKLAQEVRLEREKRDQQAAESLALLLDKLSFVQGELYSERKNREESYDAMISD